MEFGDIHSHPVAAFVTRKLLAERGLDVAPPQQQHPLPPGLGLSQPVRTLPGWLTALAASLDRICPHNVMTLHTSWTAQEVIAAEARLPESIHDEVGNDSPADWVHLLATRIYPLWLLLAAAGFARDCPLAPDIRTSCLGCSAWCHVCFRCVLFTLESSGVDSALPRVTPLETDLLPSTLSLVTVALLPLKFPFSTLCVYWWLAACLTR